MEQHLKPREWKPRRDPQDLGIEPERLAALSKETGLSNLALKVCLMRGLESARDIVRFLNPTFETLTPASKLRDMDRAVERLVRARNQGEKVRIYGDYDVDGTSGAALLAWVFREFGLTFDVRQPDRFRDGYGLNVPAIDQAKSDGVQLLITVDCGITSFDAAAKAGELGIDLVVVDHHQLDPNRGLPQALAVVNPQRPDCESGLKQVCGCGLAFYVAIALRARGRQEGWFSGRTEPNLKQHLDLVVLATAADMVSLTGDNHTLVRHGLEVLKNSQKPGLTALLRTAGLNPADVSPGDLGFVIAPRINASGRMQSASLALELLTTTNPSVAARLAQELEQINAERAETQNRIWDQVRVRVEQGIAEGRFRHGIVVASEDWHEGVVGIVASRVTETFRRPAAVISIREGVGKGSVRSYAGKDVLSALRNSAEHLIGFGGHKHAAGLSVSASRVECFAEAFDSALSILEEDAHARPLLVEGDCLLDELNLTTLREIENLGPFGPGNPEPVFVFRAAVDSQQVLKGRHLKLQLRSARSQPASRMEAIWFHAAEQIGGLQLGDEREWAGVPELNRFRGRVTPTIRVKDSRKILPIQE